MECATYGIAGQHQELYITPYCAARVAEVRFCSVPQLGCWCWIDLSYIVLCISLGRMVGLEWP